MPPLIILMPFELAHVNAVFRNAIIEDKKPLDNKPALRGLKKLIITPDNTLRHKKTEPAASY